MNNKEKYKITVFEDYIDFEGNITTEEIVGFISFFANQGYRCVENGEFTCLKLTKKDTEKEKIKMVNEEVLNKLEKIKTDYDKEVSKNYQLNKSINQMDEALRTLREEQNEKVQNLNETITDLQAKLYYHNKI